MAVTPGVAASPDLFDTGTHSPRLAGWLLLTVTVLGALLRFYSLGDDSIWSDESATWLQSSAGVVEAIARTATDTYPPGYNIFAALSLSIFGQSEWALRLPAAIFGTLTIPAAYWLGRVSAGRTVGILAALFIALSAFAIGYSQEARMYTLLMLAAALFTAATISWLARPGWPVALAAIGSGLLLLYSHPYGALAWLSVAATGAAILLRRRPGMSPVLAFGAMQLAILLGFLPWLFISLGVADHLVTGGFWIDRPTPVIAAGAILRLLGGIVGIVPILVGCILLIVRRDGAGTQNGAALAVLLAAALGPLVLGYAISQLTTPVFVTRYLACCLPAILVLAAIGFARVIGSWRAFAAVVGFAGIALGVSAATLDSAPHQEDWRGLASYLKAELRDGDCLLMSRSHWFRSLRFYGMEAPACLIQGLDRDRLAAIPAATRVLVVAAPSTPTLKSLKKLLPGGSWEKPRRFGEAIRLRVRAPGD